MQNRLVEITTEGAYLHVQRGFLCVSVKGEKLGQIAISDMSGLIIRGHGISLSAHVCARLSAENVPVVLCNTAQAPCAVVWPVSGHFAQGLHMQAQAVANKPLLKRLWAQLVKAKIEAQASVLRSFLLECSDVQSLARQVKSGDSTNFEAQAARLYWPRLMGEDFRRRQTADDINAALNYGYTVVRTAVARSIIAAGLHPSLSLHHQSRGDALRLADDLMEPFRPWVDYRAKKYADAHAGTALELTPAFKAELAAVLNMDFAGPIGASTMQTCMDRMAQSLVRVFTGEARTMELPGQPLPLFNQ